MFSHLPPASEAETILLDAAVNLLVAIIILILGWIAARWADRLTRRALGRIAHFDQTLTPLLASLIRYAIVILALVAVLERFGVATTSLIAVLGAAGLAIGLALQGTLSNVSAGVMLLLLRPFRAGDYIQAAGKSGTVREIGLFMTVLIADDMSYISAPNSAIFSGVIVNASREPFKLINFTVCIDFANDVDEAQKIIMDVLQGDKRILKVPSPTTGIAALHEYSIDLVVRCAVCNADQESVQFYLRGEIKTRFRDAGITIPARRQASIQRAEPSANASTTAAQQTAH